MKVHIMLHTLELGWRIVNIEGSQVIYKTNLVFLSLYINFVLINNADYDELSHYAEFLLFAKVPIFFEFPVY